MQIQVGFFFLLSWCADLHLSWIGKYSGVATDWGYVSTCECPVAKLLIWEAWASSKWLMVTWGQAEKQKKKKKTGSYILQKQMPEFATNAKASKVLRSVVLAWWRTCSPDPCWRRAKDDAIHLLLPRCASTDTSFTRPLKHPQLKRCIYWTSFGDTSLSRMKPIEKPACINIPMMSTRLPFACLCNVNSCTLCPACVLMTVCSGLSSISKWKKIYYVGCVFT